MMRATSPFLALIGLVVVGCGGGEEDLPPAAAPAARHEAQSAIAACVEGDNQACSGACDASSVDACTVVGLRYGTGRGLPQSEEWAKRFFQRACDLGSDRTCTWASTDDFPGLRPELVAACSMGGTDVCHSAPAASSGGTMGIYVHMTGDVMDLQRLNTVSGVWESACSSPCDRAVPPRDTYRLSAIRRTKAHPFRLEGNEGDHVTMDVDAGTQSSLGIGAAFIYIGAGVAGLGVLTALGGAADSNKQEGGQLVGGGLLAFGIGALIALPGILMVHGNASSKQTQTVARSE